MSAAALHLGMEGHGGSLGILRHLVPVVEVVAQSRLLVFVHEVGVGAVSVDGHSQEPVHYDIRVSTKKNTKISSKLLELHVVENVQLQM